uniref:Short-chain dehydrogenase/reductase 3 n=1 Tax=Sipha flava TaxID=143950 RepID=A0A2S2PZJ2_9HEMI
MQSNSNAPPVNPNAHTILAPPLTNIPWMVKNPLSLLMEIVLIFFMYLVTLYFKCLRVILPKLEKPVNGKVVLITGTGRGLGRELALKFALLGAKVACVDADQNSNEETVKLITTKIQGSTVKAYTVNVAATAEVTALAVKVEQDLGPVDILINNATVMVAHSFLGEQDHTIASTLNINLLGSFWMIRTFLPGMMKRNSGHIVAISSASSLCSLSKLSAYSASKWGLNGMMESLREELREHSNNKINTTVVMPIFINTSADYTKYINSRMPVLSLKHATEATIHGILTDEVEFTIPRVVYFTNLLKRLLPINISDSIKNIFYTKIILPPQEIQSIDPSRTIINKTNVAY